VLVLWAAGQTLLGSAPSAHAANLAPAAMRPQALAVMRTAGDVGLLVRAAKTYLFVIMIE
jgi:hypothetical protein